MTRNRLNLPLIKQQMRQNILSTVTKKDGGEDRI